MLDARPAVTSPQPTAPERPGDVVGFDLDQTLVDSRARILHSVVAGFADLGVAVTHDDIEPFLGFTLHHKAAHFAPALDPQAFVERYRHHYASPAAPESNAQAGARDALASVTDAGGRVVVVSAKLPSFIREALEQGGLDDLVDAVHGEVFGSAKAPALLAERAAVYVGDHPGDIDAGRAAGCLCVGVATGAHDQAALGVAGADVVLRDLLDFPAWYAGARLR